MQTEVHELESEQVAQTYQISVGRCALGDESPTEVVVVTDAVIQYGAATDIAHGLLLTGHLPPLLLVGVGYPGARTLPQTHKARQRDLTPTAIADREGSGGAAPFLGFLRDELSPWLMDRYGAGLAGGTYHGHSIGGLFGAWVLLREPAMFRRYCLSSPSMWWDNGTIFDHEAEYAAAHEDLDARVFVGVGADECPAARASTIRRIPEADRTKERKEAASDRVDMVAGARLFGDALADRAYPSLQLEVQVHPREDHATAGFVSLSRGLRYLFDMPR